VVSFKPLPRFPTPGKDPRYQFNRRPGGPHFAIKVGVTYGEVRSHLTISRLILKSSGRVLHDLGAISVMELNEEAISYTELLWPLQYLGKYWLLLSMKGNGR
jgi:hypothetical protein